MSPYTEPVPDPSSYAIQLIAAMQAVKAVLLTGVLRPEVLYNAMGKRKNRTSSIFAFHHCVIQHFRSQHKNSEPGFIVSSAKVASIRSRCGSDEWALIGRLHNLLIIELLGEPDLESELSKNGNSKCCS